MLICSSNNINSPKLIMHNSLLPLKLSKKSYLPTNSTELPINLFIDYNLAHINYEKLKIKKYYIF